MYTSIVMHDGSGIALHDVTFSTVVYFLTFLTLVVLAVGRVVVELVGLRRRWVARRRFAEPAPAELGSGHAELAGTVATDPPGGEAVRVRLRQRAFGAGIPRQRAVDWKEQERAVEASPFTLVLHGSGARIDVVPGPRPHLLARGTLAPTGPEERVISASLRHGERVRITGMIARAPEDGAGYREAPRRFVLQAAEGERLRIQAEITTLSDPVEHARARARRKITWACVLGSLAAVALHTALLLDSTTVTATVIVSSTCRGVSKFGSYKYACFTAKAPDEVTRFDDLDGHAKVGEQIRVSYARSYPSNFSLGDTLTPGDFSLMVMSMGTLLLWVLGPMALMQDEEHWYDMEPFDVREAA